MKFLFSCLFWIVCTSSAVFAGCMDLTKGNAFRLTRNDPHMQVINTIKNDGTVIEQRLTKKGGAVQKVTTTYWNGVVPVSRKSDASRIEIKIDADAKRADLMTPGQNYHYPMAILVNGNEVDRGSFEIRTIQKTNVRIGGCLYPIMVVRTSIIRENGTPINEEALLSTEAGMLMGNVAMTRDWNARSAVLFDTIAQK